MRSLLEYFKPTRTAGQRGLWMQSITSKDGTKRRAFCLACFREGKDWIGGELCEHLKGAQETVAATAELDQPVGTEGGA